MNHALIAAKPWYKEPWPWIIIGMLSSVVVAGIVTIWLAVVSNDGLVSDDYYKEGLAINQRFQRDKEASEKGLSADLMRSGRALRVLMVGHQAFNMPERVSLKIIHPTMAGQDQSVFLVNEGQGVFSGKLQNDLEGRWLVSLEDTAGVWRLHGEWQAGKSDNLRLQADKAN